MRGFIINRLCTARVAVRHETDWVRFIPFAGASVANDSQTEYDR